MAKFLILTLALCAAASANPILSTLGGGGGGLGSLVGSLTQLPAGLLNNGGLGAITNSLPLLGRQRRMLGSLGLGNIGNLVSDLPTSMLNTGMQTAQGALKAVTGLTNNLPLLNRQRRMLGSLGLGGIGNMVGGLTELPASMLNTGMNTAQGALKAVSGITNNLPLLNRQRRMLGSLGLGQIGNMVGGLTELPASMLNTGMQTAQGALQGGLKAVSGITGLVQPANLLGGLSG